MERLWKSAHWCWRGIWKLMVMIEEEMRIDARAWRSAGAFSFHELKMHVPRGSSVGLVSRRRIANLPCRNIRHHSGIAHTEFRSVRVQNRHCVLRVRHTATEHPTQETIPSFGLSQLSRLYVHHTQTYPLRLWACMRFVTPWYSTKYRRTPQSTRVYLSLGTCICVNVDKSVLSSWRPQRPLHWTLDSGQQSFYGIVTHRFIPKRTSYLDWARLADIRNCYWLQGPIRRKNHQTFSDLNSIMRSSRFTMFWLQKGDFKTILGE